MLGVAKELLKILFTIGTAYLHFRFAKGKEIHNLTADERKILKSLRDLDLISPAVGLSWGGNIGTFSRTGDK